MPTSAPSSASVRTSPSTPCFAETYPALNGDAASACADAITQMRPSLEAASASHAYFASRNGEVRRSASSASHRSSGNSRTGATCWKPAFGTIASSRPCRESASSTTARFPSPVVRSASSTSTPCTAQPSASSRSTIAAPIPPRAPVTSATRASVIRAEDDLGHADRLLAALALDHRGHRHLPPAFELLDVLDLERRPHARAGRDGRREAHAVQAVVDAHASRARHDLVRRDRDQGQRQVAVRDRAAERPLLGALRVDVDPLVVAGRVRERVDARLGHLEPRA